MTYSKHTLCTAIVALLALVTTGCADDASDRVSELTDPVVQAIANPSGEVNEITAPRVIDERAAQDTVSQASAFVPMAGGVGPTPQFVGGHPCIDGDEESGTFDMGCLSGGQVTGSVEYEMEQDDDTQYLLFEYANVCVEGSCIDGTMAMKIDGNPATMNYSMVVAGELTVTAAGQSLTMKYGYQMSMNGGSMTIETLVWVDGQSYVVSATATTSGGSISIRGKNGSVECTYDEATGGSCTGDLEFSWGPEGAAP